MSIIAIVGKYLESSLHHGSLYKIIDDEITDEGYCCIYVRHFGNIFLTIPLKPQQFFPEGGGI